MASNFVEFCETTSIQGIPETYRGRTACSKCAWLFVTLVMGCVTLYSLWQVAMSFLNAPLVTTVTVVTNDSMFLPEIALCYTGAIDADKLVKAGLSIKVVRLMKTMLQFAFPMNPDPLAMETGDSNGAANYDSVVKNDTMDFMKAHGLNTFDELIRFGSHGCSEIVRRAIHYENKSTIRLDSSDCQRITRPVIHQTFGACHVLFSVQQVWPSTMGGWGLILKLPRQTQLVTDLAYNHGFAVEFGLPYTFPNFNFHFLPVNKTVFIEFKATRYEKIQHRQWRPKTTPLCDDDPDIISPNYCNHKCFVRFFLEACKCAPLGLKDVFNSSAPACMPDLDLFSCYRNIGDFRGCQANCKPPCEEWSYQSTITSTDLDASVIMQQLNITDSDGIVKLSIAFPNLRYTAVTEEDTFTLDMAVSNIGGMLGLYLGCSIFTVVHALVYLFACLCEPAKIVSSTRTISSVTPFKGLTHS